MKKLPLLFILISLVIALSSCSTKKELYVLNVGDYINDELLMAFEEEYDCYIIYKEVSSNEEIYQSIQYDNYDVVIISDYMIDRMVKENLLSPIDYSLVDLYDENDLFAEAKTLIESECVNYQNYFIPYFWGTVGILYNTDVEGLEEYVFDKGLGAIFEESNYKKGMYDSSRDALCIAAMYLGYDINTDNENELKAACELLKKAKYDVWGDDNLKTLVQNGRLDMALVYSGDYLDEMYQCEADGREINFSYYCPEKTNIWVDGMCITKNSENKELAHAFLNFFSDSENMAENADYIGYCPVSKVVYDILFDPEGDYGYDYDDAIFYPYSKERRVYQYVGDNQYNLLNDLLEEAKSKVR